MLLIFWNFFMISIEFCFLGEPTPPIIKYYASCLELAEFPTISLIWSLRISNFASSSLSFRFSTTESSITCLLSDIIRLAPSSKSLFKKSVCWIWSFLFSISSSLFCYTIDFNWFFLSIAAALLWLGVCSCYCNSLALDLPVWLFLTIELRWTLSRSS